MGQALHLTFTKANSSTFPNFPKSSRAAIRRIAMHPAGYALRPFGQTDEVAKTVLFLASDESSYILGENLYIDGGMATI